MHSCTGYTSLNSTLEHQQKILELRHLGKVARWYSTKCIYRVLGVIGGLSFENLPHHVAHLSHAKCEMSVCAFFTQCGRLNSRNLALQSLQDSVECLFWWRTNLSDLEKDLSHMSHLNGFSPVYILVCLVSSSERPKRRLQLPHVHW